MKILNAVCLLTALTLNIMITAYPQPCAVAESSYKYAYVDIDKKVYFCKFKDYNYALFEVPQTYCLEILGEEDGWLKVKYAEDDGVFQAVYGYCEQDGLILSNEEPKVKYLKEKVTITFRPDDVGNMLEGLAPIELEAAYYGSLTVVNRQYSYVNCGGCFGYITGTIENYPLNPLPSQPSFSTSEGGQKGKSGTTLIIAFSITAVAAIAITVLYFSSRIPPKKLQ